MSKITITILTVIGDVLALVGVLETSSANNSGWWLATGIGGLIVIYTWIWALREAWLTHAWLWVFIIVFLEVWFGPIAWGLFGPGRLAPLAEQKILRLRDSRIPPSMVGIPAPMWTPELVKFYLQREGFKVQDRTLYRTLRRFHWLVR